MGACAACGEPAGPSARFCVACGAPLHRSSSPQSERRLITTLFADLAGSTALGESLDPERLSDVVTAWFDAMRVEIEAQGGNVQKFIGDAIVAAFGVPTAHEDDPTRALRAAIGMRVRLEQLNEQLEPRLGVRLQSATGSTRATSSWLATRSRTNGC